MSGGTFCGGTAYTMTPFHIASYPVHTPPKEWIGLDWINFNDFKRPKWPISLK